MAIAGLIVSSIGLVLGLFYSTPLACLFGFPISIVGLILSCIGRKRKKNNLSTAALVIAILALIFTAIMFVYGLVRMFGGGGGHF